MSQLISAGVPAAMPPTLASRWLFSALSGHGDSARLSVLIFHRVLPEPDPLFPGEMHARRFDALCTWLASSFRVLRLEDAVRQLEQRSLPARSLCITFDDGYADNHDVALPILRRHGLHATFFIASGFLDGGCMFNDRVIEAMRRTREPVADLAFLDGALHQLGDAAARRGAAEAAINTIKHRPQAERDALSRELLVRLGVDQPNELMMSSSQLRAMAAAGMGIGAHTRTHPILATLSPEQAAREIAGGKADLEALLGRSVSLFAYPNGRPDDDYRHSDVLAVRQAGFAAAFSTAQGVAHHRSDRFQLPRFTPWDQGWLRFALRLAQNLRAPLERRALV